MSNYISQVEAGQIHVSRAVWVSGEVGRAEEAGQVLKGCLPFRLNIGLKILYLFCSSEKFSRAINVYPVEESPRDPEKGRVQIFRLNSKLDQQIASLDTTRSFSATTFNFKWSCTSSPFAQARICSVWIASSRESAQDARPQSGLLWVFTCTDKKSPFFIQDKNIIELTRHSMKGTSSVGSVTACRVQAKTCKPLVLKPQTDIHRVWSKAHSHEFIFLPNH